jgi:hypothetical protein
MVAETTAREIGRVGLDEALELTALIMVKQPERGQRVAARWLERYMAESVRLGIADVALVAVLLQALGGGRHEEALTTLRDMATTASSRAR